MIVAGGTGGHIYPSLALASILKKQYPDVEIIFCGSNDRMEADVIPANGYRFIGLDIFTGQGNFSNKVKSLYSLLSSMFLCRQILKAEKPDICVGFGNYISAPLMIAAYLLKIPTLLHEQNSFAGKANLMLANFADAIVVCYENAIRQFPHKKVQLLGNPQESIAAVDNHEDTFFEQYAFDKEKPVITFMMGSLGSSSVSRVIDQCLSQIDQNIQILIATGRCNSYDYQTKSDYRIKILPYVDGISALKNSTVSILRAGATTLCEVASVGACAILIPSPYVPNNHQSYNAMALNDKKAAIVIPEKELNAKLLAERINHLVYDESQCALVRKNAKKLAHPNAAYEMVKLMEELTKNGSTTK